MHKTIKASELDNGDVLALPFGATATLTDVRVGKRFVNFRSEHGPSRIGINEDVLVETSMRTIRLGESLNAQVTPNCAILTIVDILQDGEVTMDREAKEHGSFLDALDYLKELPAIKTGDWNRVRIINPEMF